MGGDRVKKNNFIKMKKLYKFICLCMVIMLFPLHVVAAPENDETSLTIKYPVGNVYFIFYKVADFSEYGDFELVSPFDIYADEITNLEILEKAPEEMTTESWVNLAYTLQSYVVSERISYDFIERTSESGRITIENIDKGLYLIIGEQAESEEKIYTPAPVMMTVPNRDEAGEWDNQVVLDYSGKTSINDIYDEYTVRKDWVDDGYENKRPEQITVDLYMVSADGSGELYDHDVILNEDNNWTYTWANLPAGYKWIVYENDVPENYTVSNQVDGNKLILVNTYDEPGTPDTPTSPPGGRVPQTGQLWWPVPFLTIFGIAFFAIGWVRRKREER